MTSKQRTPKDLLADHELIGFARRAGDQVIQRASSAKVFDKARLRGEREQPAEPPTPRPEEP